MLNDFNLRVSKDVNEMSFNTHALEVPITVACVQAVAWFRDHSVEAAVFVRGVVYSADRAVWFDKAVLSLDHVTVAHLLLALHVACVVVIDCVLEAVPGVGLSHNEGIFRIFRQGVPVVFWSNNLSNKIIKYSLTQLYFLS